MNLNIIKDYFFIHKLIFKKYSILRISQIMIVKKLKVKGLTLDIGSKASINNVSNFIQTNQKIIYADKYSKNPDDLKIDLEDCNQNFQKKFQNVLLFNVLEHIYNFKNCLKVCYSLLETNGSFYGSTPFFFRIHGSPNDYFRYTEQSLVKLLKEQGFREIKIVNLNGGIFLCFFSSISLLANRIPFLNNIFFIIFQLLDLFISIFSKHSKNIYPLGYFFEGKK